VGKHPDLDEEDEEPDQEDEEQQQQGKGDGQEDHDVKPGRGRARMRASLAARSCSAYRDAGGDDGRRQEDGAVRSTSCRPGRAAAAVSPFLALARGFLSLSLGTRLLRLSLSASMRSMT